MQRVTRSATRSATAVAGGGTAVAVVETKTNVTKTNNKRKTTAASATPKEPAKKKARATKGSSETAKTAVDTSVAPPRPTPPAAAVAPVTTADGQELVPAVLTFSFEEAKQHLIGVDPRFEDVFRRVKCKPFEHLERLDPFRTLAHSILGQQISWKAAAAITLKFRRLFDPSISDSPDRPSDFFPSAHQVITKDIATLRTAGLSGRKAEYILDLAVRFADGRLSTRKLLEADDEELYRILTEVRGIGVVVHMFAIFSLRRPDILPVGDLGVQKGMLRWFISLHSPSMPVSLRKDKLVEQEVEDAIEGGSAGEPNVARAATPDVSSLPPALDALLPSTPKKRGKGKATAGDSAAEKEPVESGMALPQPFTPSINRTLNMLGKAEEGETTAKVPPLPEGLTVAQMKTRLSGKKVKGALLTPKEMEALAESWRPYRSLGVYYMWALAEEPKA
ncbi:DNA glycosylase [Daedaleopsis nitida]|nr:DNA glycosylase [Daedaleopsis nitida]